MTITNFENFKLSPEMLRGLSKMGFSDPTPVQEKAIAPMMEQKDLLVQAPTGTGKTGAFGIPIVERVEPGNNGIQAVILCPTRELAIQTAAVFKRLTAFKPGIRVLALYGGEPIGRQIAALRRRPQIIVATPGRMLDHIHRRTTRLGQVRQVVLDEADRMLDMGFRDDMDEILGNVPERRQTVLFSATLSNEVKRIAAAYQTDAQTIQVRQETLTVDCVQQFYSEIRGRTKTSTLVQLLRDKNFHLSLVFVATKSMADELAKQLESNGLRAGALHGDLQQRQRDKVMASYRNGQVNVLVATDVAARGIDVNNIDVVVNYDIPQDSDSYVHRIGRTGRANQAGLAYTFIYHKERSRLQQIMSATKAVIRPVALDPGQPIPEKNPAVLVGFDSGAGRRSAWSDKPQQRRRGRSNSHHSKKSRMQMGA